LGGQVARQGYVALNTDSVLYPAIAANLLGQVAIAFSVEGPNTFPSTGYAKLDGNGHVSGSVHITGAGVGAEDGFTGYAAFGGDGVSRWGDYSAAAVAPDGSFWIASEFIGPRGNAERTVNANWSTFVTHINPFSF